MGKTGNGYPAKRDNLSNIKDRFFSNTKPINTFSQKSSNHPSKFNKRRKLFNETSQHSNKLSTQGSSNAFFLKKSDSQQSFVSNDLGTKSANTSEKKPFDKKKWRMQKYSKKYKLDQWEEKRRKTMAREYYKQLKHDDSAKFDVQRIYETEENSDNESAEQNQPTDDNQLEVDKTKKPKQPKIFQTAQSRYQEIQKEKEEKRAEALKRKAEKQAALETYRKKKLEKYKKLSQKTKKGQPIMKHRMEMLLEQIQKTCT